MGGACVKQHEVVVMNIISNDIITTFIDQLHPLSVRVYGLWLLHIIYTLSQQYSNRGETPLQDLHVPYSTDMHSP